MVGKRLNKKLKSYKCKSSHGQNLFTMPMGMEFCKHVVYHFKVKESCIPKTASTYHSQKLFY